MARAATAKAGAARRHAPANDGDAEEYGSLPDLYTRLESSAAGLTSAEAATRLREYGPNRLRAEEGTHPLAILFRQFRSPMTLILLVAVALSYGLGETEQALIVGFIVVASAGLGFYQEYRASNAVAALRKRIAATSMVLRDGTVQKLPSHELVPGDVVALNAGALVAADAVLMKADTLYADEASLTGESLPVTKAAVAEAMKAGPDNIVHMGTTIRSGDGMALVVTTGNRTAFGQIATSMSRLEPETSFAAGTRRFGLLMTQVMLVMVTLMLAANVLLGRPVLDSLLFAAALAVGITPELLPAIVSVTLSQGAKHLTAKGVLVRRLVAIENLGAMDVLCTDKTGTLTQGNVRLDSAVDADGKASEETLRWAFVNASLQGAMPNPLDEAIIVAGASLDTHDAKRLAELPYDFERRRLSVLAATADGTTLICKGAVGSILPACITYRADGADHELTAARLKTEEARLAAWSQKGLRVLAVATKPMGDSKACALADESGLALVGYLLFADPLKAGAADAVAALKRHGIKLKILSGDNRFVAAYVGEAVGLSHLRVVSGEELAGLTSRSLQRRVTQADIFAEVTPAQKEAIISALRHNGRTVGYLGDGINDGPALRAADIGISVDSAVDAAKAAADVLLLERDLNVLLDGVVAGRTAFGNTLKYIAITISANLGNMVSMAIASLFLPFLPMLATQILLNNLLSDLPMLTISTDRVDSELLARPRHWDLRSLLRGMVGFGLLSSIFDALTFVTLLLVFHANAPLFQTGWFIESLLTELAIVAVMRSQRRLFSSMPSGLLIGTSLAVAAVTLALPYSPLADMIGFVPLPAPMLLAIAAIVIAYVAASEFAKRRIGVLRPGVHAR
ncbi:MAG: magnesium-translocating P-type ATPase [Devosia sp.]